MTTTLSSKGQIVLPAAARRRLGLKAGTKFACRVQGSQIVLTPAEIKQARPRLVRSKLTGLIVTQGPKGAPVVTTEQVRAILADFP
jgi:AbrB family looped-hinge helix DNA binding protein